MVTYLVIIGRFLRGLEVPVLSVVVGVAKHWFDSSVSRGTGYSEGGHKVDHKCFSVRIKIYLPLQDDQQNFVFWLQLPL